MVCIALVKLGKALSGNVLINKVLQSGHYPPLSIC